MSRRPAQSALAVLLACLGGTVAGPAAEAGAGTYVVHQCRTPDGAAAPIAGWDFVGWATSIDHWGDTCPRGGLRLTMDPFTAHAKEDLIKAWWRAPADTKVVRYSFWRTVRVGAGTHYYATPIEKHAGTEEFVGKGCSGDSCPGLGDPGDPLADGNRIEGAPQQPVDAVGYYLSCGYSAPADPDCPAANPAVEVVISRAEITLADDRPPVLAAPPTGGLLATTTLSGPQAVALQTADQGGGVAEAAIEVDGRVVSRGGLGAGCAPPYVVAVPCPLAASGTLTLDTATLADGDHDLRLLVADAAGNVTPWGPVRIRTHNAPPDTSCSLDPALPGAGPLAAGLMPVPLRGAKAPVPRRTLRVAYGRRTQLAGTLRNPDGSPIAGGAVCVVARTDGADAPFAELARTSTGADGAFALPLAAGPSREVVAIYRVGAGAVLAQARLQVVPRVDARLHRRVVRNGHRMVITGRLAGGPFPRRGVRLNLQAVKDGAWTGFGDAFRTDARGRFRVAYRFRATFSTQRYRLRIRAFAQAGYPYVTGFSRALTVRVRP